MLKDARVIRQVGRVLDDATEAIIKRVLRDYSAINGREEEITAQLRGELNRGLMKEVQERLNRKAIGSDDACVQR